MKKANKAKATGTNPDHPKWMTKWNPAKAHKEEIVTQETTLETRGVEEVILEEAAEAPAVVEATGNVGGVNKESA